MWIKDKLVSLHFFARVGRAVDYRIGKVARQAFYRKGEIQNNLLFVMTFDRVFTDNERYIVEELLRRKLPIEIVWVVKPNGEGEYPEELTLVENGTAEMFEYQARAKVWLDNALNCVWMGMPKKEGQYYLNTWHGSMGIKRLGGDANWMRLAGKCGKLTDYCITNSTFEENVFRETFWKTTPFLPYGHARNDTLLHPECWEEIRSRVLRELGIPEEKKVLLYAPTFRDDGDVSFLDMDYDRLRKAMEQRFGGEWVILMRLHFKNKGRTEALPASSSWLVDATRYPEMQSLMIAADAGITDYSSWAYDYVLTRKPMFIYASDLAKYDQERGFYYPLEETPFAIAQKNDMLEEAIMAFDPAAYDKEIDRFLNDRGCYENGDAAVKIADKICELMGLE